MHFRFFYYSAELRHKKSENEKIIWRLWKWAGTVCNYVQGMAAMLAVDTESGTEAIETAMNEAIARVITAQITYAARDSDIDGFAIKAGEYLALKENNLFGSDTDIAVLLEKLADTAKEQDAEFITMFYGSDVSEEDAQKAEAIFAAACPDAEVSLLPGGQPVYYYIISIE